MTASDWAAFASCAATLVLAFLTWRLAVATRAMARSTETSVKQMAAQVEVSTLQLQLQSDQLRYYYQPGLWLQVDYFSTADHGRGLPVKVWTVNQATVFGIQVSLVMDPHEPRENVVRDMRQMPRGSDGKVAGREAVLRELQDEDSLRWECGSISGGEEWWMLLAGLPRLQDAATLVAHWRHVGGERWHQEWRLNQLQRDLLPQESEWSIEPVGAPSRLDERFSST